MKKNGHPEYQEVLFVDSATGFKFVCGTTMKSSQKENFEGKSLPVVHLPISASSHPFFVGGKQIIDTEGRVDKFNKRYQAVQAKAQSQEAAKAQDEAQAAKAKAAPRKKSK